MLQRLLPAVVLCSLAIAQPRVSAPEPGQWESLFNGKDLTGWVPMHEVSFVATNGNLRLVKGMGWLRTEKQYTDFVLEVEWRALVPFNAYDLPPARKSIKIRERQNTRGNQNL